MKIEDKVNPQECDIVKVECDRAWRRVAKPEGVTDSPAVEAIEIPLINEAPAKNGLTMWAIGAMRSGNIVECENGMLYHMVDGLVTLISEEDVELQWDPERFLENRENVRWNIYKGEKPKKSLDSLVDKSPHPWYEEEEGPRDKYPVNMLTANIGDLVLLSNGKYNQIQDILFPGHISYSDGKVLCCRNGGVRLKNNVSNHYITAKSFCLDGSLYEKRYETLLNVTIVDWERLASEGTKDWAWQMMLLGYEVALMTANERYRCRIVSGVQQSYSYKTFTWLDYPENQRHDWCNDIYCIGWELYEEKRHQRYSQCFLCNEPIKEEDVSEQWVKSSNGLICHDSCLANAIAQAKEKNASRPEGKEASSSKFVIGQYVRVVNVSKDFEPYLIVNKLYDGTFIVRSLCFPECADFPVAETELVSISARDVVIDLGNGIKGPIDYQEDIKGNVVLDWFYVINDVGDNIAELYLDAINEPLRSVIKRLIKRQKAENETT